MEGNELDMFLRELCTSVGNVDSEASKNVNKCLLYVMFPLRRYTQNQEISQLSNTTSPSFLNKNPKFYYQFVD